MGFAGLKEKIMYLRFLPSSKGKIKNNGPANYNCGPSKPTRNSSYTTATTSEIKIQTIQIFVWDDLLEMYFIYELNN